MILRLLFGTLLLCTTALARASDCYYYWTHQCVEVIDASKRQLRQSVLISPSVNYLHSDEASCEITAEARQHPLMAQLLEAFNASAGKIRGCDTPLTDITLKVFDNPQKATWHYDRAIRPSESKTVIPVDNLPFL